MIVLVGSAGTCMSWEYGESWELHTGRVWQLDCRWPSVKASSQHFLYSD